MKKLFAIAIVSLALAACGGKAKTDDTMGNTGGDTTGATGDTGATGGDTYGGATYGNPCAAPANPCAAPAPTTP